MFLSFYSHFTETQLGSLLQTAWIWNWWNIQYLLREVSPYLAFFQYSNPFSEQGKMAIDGILKQCSKTVLKLWSLHIFFSHISECSLTLLLSIPHLSKPSLKRKKKKENKNKTKNKPSIIPVSNKRDSVLADIKFLNKLSMKQSLPTGSQLKCDRRD